jgi:hypothetical protein
MPVVTLRRFLTTAVGLGALLTAPFWIVPAATAQTAAGLTSAWGKACKMRVVDQFGVPMSDAVVNLGATEQQGINDGSITLPYIKKHGLSFNWEVSGKKISGYCNVNGKGKITEFKQGLN